ncbi:MAG: acyloxyacyl hydrolase [Proteobacteria bacterium TMED261]|nr:MAG: acyloxyacyl hydrolase [Proteobacteria bacterium TMED261]
MKNFILHFLTMMITFSFISYSYSDEKLSENVNKSNETELNIYTGMFDFSDDKQASGVLGLQHQNDELFRESFLGKVSPITGGFITEKNAFYFYSGAQAEYDVGLITITPSFAPGYYNIGDGKDLGSPIEFKSEVQVSLNLSEATEFGMSYNHISNASIGEKNPGANSYMINFLKKF